MTWYYQIDGQVSGPISANDFKALLKARTITAETPVRRNDMTEWKPLRHFVKAAPSSPQPAASESADAPPRAMENRRLEAVPDTAVPSPAAQPSSACSECGRTYPSDDLIRLDDAHICAACKPRFIQKLREGVRGQGALNYAGFWVRFGAKLVDGLVLFVINFAIGFVYGLTAGGVGESVESMGNNLALQFLYHGLGMAYTTFFLGRYGATPGKMAFGLRVVSPDGGAIGYLRALGRQLAEYLSGMLLMIGYIMAAFDSEKRALHDRICNTRVVRG